MYGIQNISTRLRNIGLAAIVATASAAALGLASPARAASDYLLELDGVKGESKAAAADLDNKGQELQQALADLQAQMDKVETLQAEFVKLGFGIIVVSGSNDDIALQNRQKMDSSEQVFDDQIAGLLDPDVVTAVKQNFEKLRASLEAGGGFDTSEVSASLDAMSSAVSAASDGVDSLVAAGTQALGKSKELTGHVTLIK